MATAETMMLRRGPFVKAVAEALRDRCGVRAGDRLLVAVSGGADSVALLRALAALKDQPHWALDLHVGHVHHHLRDDADADARFVAELAHQLQLPHHHRDIQPASQPGNLEAVARRMRYSALGDIADAVDAAFIVTAHQSDDQLETLLMRLLRGASVRGMAGIRWRRRLGEHVIIRPMLGVDHAAAIDWLQQIGQSWREDHTNAEPDRWRARLRTEVLPTLRAMRPDAAAKAQDTADALDAAMKIIDRTVRSARRRHVRSTSPLTAEMDRDRARSMGDALLTGLIRHQCLLMGAAADQMGGRVLEPIVRAAMDRSGEKRIFDLSGGVVVEVQRDAIRWSAQSPQPPMPHGAPGGASQV